MGEAGALLGSENVPAIETHQGGAGDEHGADRQTEASVGQPNAFQVRADSKSVTVILASAVSMS